MQRFKVICLLIFTVASLVAADTDVLIQSGNSTSNRITSRVQVNALTNLRAGTLTASNLTAATIAAIDSSKKLVSATNTGNGSVVLSENPTINGGQMSVSIALATDDTYHGFPVAGATNSGGVTQWDAVYCNSSGQWVIADANGSGTYPARGIAVATAATGNAVSVLTVGTVRNDAWNWTPGGTIYLSGTAGALTQTAPSTSGDKVQQVGFAITADIAYFNFASGEFLTIP